MALLLTNYCTFTPFFVALFAVYPNRAVAVKPRFN